MEFDELKEGRSAGKIAGFIVMYLIFTIVLYFVLDFLKKIPENWGFFHIILITLSVVLLGTLIKLMLK